MTDANSTLDEPLLQRFVLHLRNGNRRAATNLLEGYVREHPEKASSALLFVASLLSQNGQYADAIPLYLEALRLAPTQPLTYFHLGLAYHGLDRRPERNRVWDELPKRFPSHPVTDYQVALRLIEDGHEHEAKPLLEHTASIFEKSSPLRAQVLETLRRLVK